MFTTVLKASAFLAGFFALLWLGVQYGEKHTPVILAAVIDYVAIWQFLFARAVAEGLTRHYSGTALANLLPPDKLIVTPKFVRAMALLFFAVSAAVLFVF
jgi:hypothetical protein